MIWQIARLGLRQSWRSGALPVACTAMFALLVVSGWISHERLTAVNEQRLAYQRQVQSNWHNQPDRHPHRVAHYGYLVFRPAAPLSFLDPGVESFAGTSVFLEAHRQNTANFSEARQSSGILRLGELSPAMVLQTILPLVLIFLGFPAVAREREGGTLSVVLAQGVRWRTLLTGKALALIAMAAMTALPGLLAIAIIAPEVLGVRALLMAAAYALYITVAAIGIILVSAVRSTSRTALTSLVMLWILLCVVLPRAAQTLGVMLVPTPSKSQFDAALEKELAATGDSHNPNDPHFAELRKATLERYGVTDVKQLPINYGALVMQEAERISSDIFRRHYGGLLRTFEQQNRIAAWGAAINPYLAIRNLSMGLAGSGLSQYVRFQWQAEDFRFTMVQRLNELHLKEISHENNRTQKLKQERWREFAEFDYRQASIAEVLQVHWPAALSLIAWLAALTIAVARVGLRLPV